MSELTEMLNEVYETEVQIVLANIKTDDRQKGFQLIGWSSNIAPEARNSTNMSDGFVFADKPTAEYYAALTGFHISRIKEVKNGKSLWMAYCEQSLKDLMHGTNFCGKYWKQFLCPNEA